MDQETRHFAREGGVLIFCFKPDLPGGTARIFESRNSAVESNLDKVDRLFYELNP